MCTATWIRTAEGYEVFFNRDELKTRKPGLPPRPREARGVRFLAPEDGDAGGTWLGVNELGVSVGLANGPSNVRGEEIAVRAAGSLPPADAFRSRGLLVLDLLTCTSLEEVGRQLERLVREAAYKPFELFSIALPNPSEQTGPSGQTGPGGRSGPGWRSERRDEPQARVWTWNGRALAQRTAAGSGALLMSSSRDFERARAEREAVLSRMRTERGRIDEELLAAFHASHEPERGPWSPCMHREDASTVSESRIRVGDDSITFTYGAGPPCELRDKPTRARLARRSRD